MKKEKITVALAAMADGRKLPPLVILKGKRPPPPKDIPSGIRVTMSSNGWMNEEGCCYWVKQIWAKATVVEGRKLLVWDAFRAHRTAAIKYLVGDRSVENSDMAMIPGGCTSKLQPADLSWNKPFKAIVQQKYDAWMIGDDHTFTKGGAMRKPTVKLMLQWIKHAWEALDKEVVIKSLKKAGISNEMDGTEDNLVWEDSGDENDSDDEIDFVGFNAQDVEQAGNLATIAMEELDRELEGVEDESYMYETDDVYMSD